MQMKQKLVTTCENLIRFQRKKSKFKKTRGFTIKGSNQSKSDKPIIITITKLSELINYQILDN